MSIVCNGPVYDAYGSYRPCLLDEDHHGACNPDFVRGQTVTPAEAGKQAVADVRAKQNSEPLVKKADPHLDLLICEEEMIELDHKIATLADRYADEMESLTSKRAEVLTKIEAMKNAIATLKHYGYEV